MAEIMTSKQASEKWGVSTRRINEYIRGGKIKGVYKIGAAWVMPADTKKPPDERVTTGKYVGIKRTKKNKTNENESE